jgi:hypothetical protein
MMMNALMMSDRVRRFVDLRTGGVAGLSGLDDPEGLLDDLISWSRGERRIDDPVSRDDLVRVFVGLARDQKNSEEAIASVAAAAVQLLVGNR